MGLLDLLKGNKRENKPKTAFYSRPNGDRNPSTNLPTAQQHITSASSSKKLAVRYDYPIADFQWNFVKDEVNRLNDLLKTLECTKDLHMNSDALTNDSYFRYEPFTPKTGKISKYPCMLHACSTVYMGYSVSIHYDVKDVPCKGTIHTATPKYAYTIDFKNSDGELLITKVIATDSKLDNHKLYHIQKDGTIYTK